MPESDYTNRDIQLQGVSKVSLPIDEESETLKTERLVQNSTLKPIQSKASKKDDSFEYGWQKLEGALYTNQHSSLPDIKPQP